MTENITDPTTPTVSADQSSAAVAEPPTAPEGSIYLSDVFAVVRRHALANGWCYTAESVTKRALNEGLSFKALRTQNPARCGAPSCEFCEANEAASSDPNLADERFTPVEGTDPLITKARLKEAIRKAIELGYDWDQPRRLYSELITTYGLDQVALPVLTYTVTFTVTDEQLRLRGRAADRAGMADALEFGATTGFTVSAESAEEATPTLMS